MEQANINISGTENRPSVFWIIVKIAFVILIVFLGIKFFSEKSNSGEEENFVERKKTKPTKTRKKKDDK
jgi:hypothetical protein